MQSILPRVNIYHLQIILFALSSQTFLSHATGINFGPPIDKSLLVPVLTKTIVEGERMTASEVLSMEPACLVIGMGRALGKQWGLPNGTFPNGVAPATSNYPMLYLEGSSTYAQWFHHYCWGELNRLRYFSATNSEKKDKYLAGWASGVNYSLSEAKRRDNRWSYLNKVRSDLAATQFESKKYLQAVTTATEVIATAPEIEATHITLIDSLITLNKRPEAEAAALDALKRFGKKKTLLRRYKSLTGNAPDIPDPEPDVVAGPVLPVPAQMDAAAPTQELQTKEAGSASAPPLESTLPSPSIGNETNPFCRFCPDPISPAP